MPTTKDVLALIVQERDRQNKKWGWTEAGSAPVHDELCWLAILAEEVGEASTCALKYDGPGFAEEMVQVAAVAVAILEEWGPEDRNAVSPMPICPDCAEQMTKARQETEEGDWYVCWLCGCQTEEVQAAIAVGMMKKPKEATQ